MRIPVLLAFVLDRYCGLYFESKTGIKHSVRNSTEVTIVYNNMSTIISRVPIISQYYSEWEMQIFSINPEEMYILVIVNSIGFMHQLTMYLCISPDTSMDCSEIVRGFQYICDISFVVAQNCMMLSGCMYIFGHPFCIFCYELVAFFTFVE